MEERRNYAGIDYFRIAAALAVIAIHTAPLSSWNETADYLITYCLGRLAVPFFLICTGFFTVASGLDGDGAFHRSMRKLVQLYVLSTLLYLPLNLYAGDLPADLLSFLRVILFDGTFYHLWYLPAVILGSMLLRFLLKRLSFRRTFLIVAAAYTAGLFGDSLYALVPSWLKGLYELSFKVSSYTRNGLLFAPAFLLIGVALSRFQKSGPCVLPLLFWLFLLLAEGYVTWSLDLQRHNSFYAALVPCSYYLFRLLLRVPGSAPRSVRDLSLWIYLLHPLCIALLLVIAKVFGVQAFWMQHSLIHFIFVSVFTVLLAYWLLRLKNAAAVVRPQYKNLLRTRL